MSDIDDFMHFGIVHCLENFASLFLLFQHFRGETKHGLPVDLILHFLNRQWIILSIVVFMNQRNQRLFPIGGSRFWSGTH